MLRAATLVSWSNSPPDVSISVRVVSIFLLAVFSSVDVNLPPSCPTRGAYLGKFSRSSLARRAASSASMPFSESNNDDSVNVNNEIVRVSTEEPSLSPSLELFGSPGRGGWGTMVDTFPIKFCAFSSSIVFFRKGAKPCSKGLCGKNLPTPNGRDSRTRLGVSTNESCRVSFTKALAASALSVTNKFCTKLPSGASKISAESFASVIAASVSIKFALPFCGSFLMSEDAGLRPPLVALSVGTTDASTGRLTAFVVVVYVENPSARSVSLEASIASPAP
mmetsp:Transcript_15460/g.21833  ORF Transcript_15460/g.21833 Transcript_15460/m.21833 type:complete len:278 (-) Transcript_15460:1470-2303(-)